MKQRFTEAQIIKIIQEAKGGLTVKSLGSRISRTELTRPNERWSVDFVHDALENGRRIRCLTVVDDYSRTCLGIVADSSLSGRRVCEELSLLMSLHGKPTRLLSDNGPEFTSNQVLSWSRSHSVKGIDTRTIQEYMGHARIDNTVIYTQLDANRFNNLWR